MRNLEPGGESNEVRFEPTLQEQRHSKVYNILRDKKATTVVDLGCGEGGLMRILLNDGKFGNIAGVDKEEALLMGAIKNCKPEESDLVSSRSRRVILKFLKGDVCECASNIKQYEAYVMVEVVEHLEPDDVDLVFRIVLGEYNPRLFIVTTPNKDFNVNFKTLRHKNYKGLPVRHPDHKFEWTHKEFKDICEYYATSYGYSTELSGVGFLPNDLPNSLKFPGLSCTQICTFNRNGSFVRNLDETSTAFKGVVYELVSEIHLPYKTLKQSSISQVVNEIIRLRECLMLQTYIEIHGSTDKIESKDPYSEKISPEDIILADESCLKIRYDMCMLIPSIRCKVFHVDYLKKAVCSTLGNRYFRSSDASHFIIEKSPLLKYSCRRHNRFRDEV